jgi:hypothetical protein
MKRRLPRCCGYTLRITPEDQAVVDAFARSSTPARIRSGSRGDRLGVPEFSVGSPRPPCGVSVFSAGLPRLSRPR